MGLFCFRSELTKWGNLSKLGKLLWEFKLSKVGNIDGLIRELEKWRLYLAKHFDMPPTHILADSKLFELGRWIRVVGYDNLEFQQLAQKLEVWAIGDNPLHAAKLLMKYLNPDDNSIRDATINPTINCRNCGEMGHVVSSNDIKLYKKQGRIRSRAVQ